MHIRELSSIRGIAALVVLFGHVFAIIDRHSPIYASASPITNSVFDFLGHSFNGNGAVEIFFVLSGLVLSLSLRKYDRIKLKTALGFYVRRVFRIFPALWISLIVALLLLSFERNGCPAGFCTDWAAGAFQEDYTLKRIILSFLSIYVHLNGPMWSLRAELFYSFLFPVMFFYLWQPKTRWTTFLFILLLALAPISRFYSVHYALAFALGSIIPLLDVKSIILPYRFLTLLALLVLFFFRQVLPGYEEKTYEIVEMFASFVVVGSIFHKKINVKFLRNDVLFYIGEISYSIYVLHFPLLFALLYASEKVVGMDFIRNSPNLFTIILGIITLGVTLGVSIINFKYIEVPFQSLGKKLSKRIG